MCSYFQMLFDAGAKQNFCPVVSRVLGYCTQRMSLSSLRLRSPNVEYRSAPDCVADVAVHAIACRRHFAAGDTRYSGYAAAEQRVNPLFDIRPPPLIRRP